MAWPVLPPTPTTVRVHFPLAKIREVPTAAKVVLEFSVLDAFIAGLSTAFFGALVAGGAFLLRQVLALQEKVRTLEGQMGAFKVLQQTIKSARSRTSETLIRSAAESEVDAHEP